MTECVAPRVDDVVDHLPEPRATRRGWAKNVESLPIVDHLVETFPDLHWVDTDSHCFLVV